MSARAYFDHAATTPLRAAALKAMEPFLLGATLGAAGASFSMGNASSTHAEGRAARAALDDARCSVAESLGVNDEEVLFTSSGTESDNLALRGSCWASSEPLPHLVVGATEHAAVLRTARWLEARGQVELTEVLPESEGQTCPEKILESLKPTTALVSFAWVNSETGVIGPVKELGSALRERGVRFHVDAVQALGKLDVSPHELPCDLLTLSAHKVGGPTGCGVLFSRQDLKLQPALTGGDQEQGLRPGTECLPTIVGSAKAMTESILAREKHADTMLELTTVLEEGLLALPGTLVNGAKVPRVPGILNARFQGALGSVVMQALDLAGFAVSTGSACSAGSIKPSHVLTAMGQSEDEARRTVRFSLGYGNDTEQVKMLLRALPAILDAARLEVPS